MQTYSIGFEQLGHKFFVYSRGILVLQKIHDFKRIGWLSISLEKPYPVEKNFIAFPINKPKIIPIIIMVNNIIIFQLDFQGEIIG